MESDSAAILNETGGKSRQVSITIKDHQYSSPTFPNPLFYVYFTFLYVLSIPFMYLLAVLRIQIIDINHPSPFEFDALFMVMCIVAVFVVVLTSLIMISTIDISLMTDIHYTILKSIGGFSEMLAFFSLAMVLYVPHNHLRIRYILLCVFLVIVVAFFLIWRRFLCDLDESPQHNKTGWVPKIFLIGLFVPLTLVLVLLIPSNFNFIVSLVIQLYFFIVPVSSVTWCLYITRAPQVIQQDKNNKDYLCVATS